MADFDNFKDNKFIICFYGWLDYKITLARWRNLHCNFKVIRLQNFISILHIESHLPSTFYVLYIPIYGIYGARILSCTKSSQIQSTAKTQNNHVKFCFSINIKDINILTG